MIEDRKNPTAGKQTPGRGMAVLADKDSLRAIFHLLVGKPDSTQKIFTRAVEVTPPALHDLHERISEKLATHHIEALVASADVSFEDKTTSQLGGWAEFEAFRWTTPKITREIRLKWQFLLSVQGYDLPQQHSITVKLCSEVRPIEVLQAMLSKHPADDEGSAISFAPTICRVDFISHSLGQELITVVEDWNQSLRQPDTRSSFVSQLDRYKDWIAGFIDYSTPILFAFACIAILKVQFTYTISSQPLSTKTAVELMQWLILSLIAIYIADKISSWLSKTAYGAIEKIWNVFHVPNDEWR